MSIRLRKRERDRTTIIAEILDIARDGVLKTNIMWRARLSYYMLDEYLGLMVNSKLLDRELLNDKVVYKTSDKGTEFLYHSREILQLLATENGEHGLHRAIQLLPRSLPAQSLHGRL
jgi:predicted transcriptional regulator